MATVQEFQAVITEIDTETTRIAGVIEDLVGQLAARGLSVDEEAAIFANLRDAATALRAVGAGVVAEEPPVEGEGGGAGGGEGEPPPVVTPPTEGEPTT